MTIVHEGKELADTVIISKLRKRVDGYAINLLMCANPKPKIRFDEANKVRYYYNMGILLITVQNSFFIFTNF